MNTPVNLPPVQLLVAGPDDADSIDRLVAAFHEHEGVNVAAQARRASMDTLLAMPAQGRILLVQHADTGTVGYAVLAFGFSLEFGGRDAFLDELFIADEYRGIGSPALTAVCTWARQQQLCAVHLEVERDNAAAKALYLKSGFEDRSHYNLMSLHIAHVGQTKRTQRSRPKKGPHMQMHRGPSLGRKRPKEGK